MGLVPFFVAVLASSLDLDFGGPLRFLPPGRMGSVKLGSKLDAAFS